ncbi:MAG: hypothetical protein IJN53_07075 [Oscillospiraceae bacterium]|nr:hypothetical protein [Oscillospiraceae bacterium]
MTVKAMMLGAGLGAAAGAVAVMMMGSENPTRKLATKAADKVEQAACRVGSKLNQALDKM